MVRFIALVTGILFIFAGVAGFIPRFMPNGLLFGVFAVDIMHNVFHLATGVFAIRAAATFRLSKLYFQVIGIIYALLAAVGFYDGGAWIMRMNFADHVLHLVFAVVALYIGFTAKNKVA